MPRRSSEPTEDIAMRVHSASLASQEPAARSFAFGQRGRAIGGTRRATLSLSIAIAARVHGRGLGDGLYGIALTMRSRSGGMRRRRNHLARRKRGSRSLADKCSR